MTEVVGDYGRDGYAHVKGLVPKEVARAMLASYLAACASVMELPAPA